MDRQQKPATKNRQQKTPVPAPLERATGAKSAPVRSGLPRYHPDSQPLLRTVASVGEPTRSRRGCACPPGGLSLSWLDYGSRPAESTEERCTGRELMVPGAAPRPVRSAAPGRFSRWQSPTWRLLGAHTISRSLWQAVQGYSSPSAPSVFILIGPSFRTIGDFLLRFPSANSFKRPVIFSKNAKHKGVPPAAEVFAHGNYRPMATTGAVV